ncbi:MAG TPA: TIR domain-containing protein [Longimicrobium sp.]|nr:TIR domain-containing protein [Longimicrobium sp.]
MANVVDVFKTVGLPQYTYIKPAYYGALRMDIAQPGKHVLIEGPSGVGKTCVVKKILEDLGWGADKRMQIHCRDGDAEARIDAFFHACEHESPETAPAIVIDDIHLLSAAKRAEIGGRLKRLSDRVFETDWPPKAILIGIPTAGSSLLTDAPDLGTRLGIRRVGRASDHEIDTLISKGEEELDITFEDRHILVTESAGNFSLAQAICRTLCASENIFATVPESKTLYWNLEDLRRTLMHDLSGKYSDRVCTFTKGIKWRPGGTKPYLEILLALSKLSDSVISFEKILRAVPERRRASIKAVRHLIPKVINPPKGEDLRKLIAFDPEAGFSIEDPVFRYYLTNLDVEQLCADLGIEVNVLEHARSYAYDIGFSFAGEARPIVDAVNTILKNQGVTTFYDYDQQAVLLATDLEDTLQRIYKESCRFYVVFLDHHYYRKVWTRFEKDIMTSSGRKGHVIPVVLDDAGTRGAAGIPAGMGRIDLSEQWTEMLRSKRLSRKTADAIQTKCVSLLLEKLNDP